MVPLTLTLMLINYMFYYFIHMHVCAHTQVHMHGCVGLCIFREASRAVRYPPP